VTIGRPLAIVSGLIVLLTYLLIESRTPDQGPRVRMQEALQSMQLHEAELNRDVLMARAGLLPNYDSLARGARALSHDLQTLEKESAALSKKRSEPIRKEIAALAAAVKEKLTWIDYLKSDNALLRNSVAYFNQSMRLLGTQSGTRQHAIDVATLSHAMLRFIQSPEGGTREEAEAALARISALSKAQPELKPLAVHGQIVVKMLANVDSLLAQIVSPSTGDGEEALLQAILAYAAQGERRAQEFRLLLYLGALVLLAYILHLATRLRERARELRRKEMQLIQANKMTSLGTLVSSVAHEINNPNQVVLMNSTVLARAWSDAVEVLDNCNHEGKQFSLAGLPYREMRETTLQLVQEVEDGARRIERIVGDLKGFARPGGSSNERFPLNDVVQRAIRLLTHLIHKKTDNFRVHLAEAMPYLQGNSQQVEQVVVNLVINALEALTDRRRCITVSTYFNEAGNTVGVVVEDEGVGIEQENISHLGEPFFTTKEASGGTGLGLAITSTLIRMHNGRLDFMSEPGKGTKATVEFPCATETRNVPIVKGNG
jgi:signal transduction histidine kinase